MAGGLQGMAGDYTGDDRGWQRLAGDSRGWQGMAGEARDDRGMAGDGRELQGMTGDGKGWLPPVTALSILI